MLGSIIAEKIVKSKRVPDGNSRTVEEIFIPLDKGQEPRTEGGIIK